MSNRRQESPKFSEVFGEPALVGTEGKADEVQAKVNPFESFADLATPNYTHAKDLPQVDCNVCRGHGSLPLIEEGETYSLHGDYDTVVVGAIRSDFVYYSNFNAGEQSEWRREPLEKFQQHVRGRDDQRIMRGF